MEVWELFLKQPGYGTIADCFWLMGYFPCIAGMIRADRLALAAYSQSA